MVAVADAEDYDPSTDMYIDASWASLFGSWYGIASITDDFNFNVAEDR